MALVQSEDIGPFTPIGLAVQQRQASPGDAQDRLLRILRGRLDIQREQPRRFPASRKLAHQGCDTFGIGKSGNAIECRLKRLETLLLQPLNVNASRKEI